MDSPYTVCQFCEKVAFKYTCPKCNALYCSIACYKTPEHLKCTEAFYKSCIQEELSSDDRNDMKKIYEILKSIHETDAGIEHDFNAEKTESDLDEDDISDGDGDNNGNDDYDEEDLEDIATRMQNVDINDADEVWEHLSMSERAEFKKLIENNKIMDLVPEHKPWWSLKKTKIIDINNTNNDTLVPEIEKNIPKLSSIFSKAPSPCLHYNLWNILCSYAAMVRHFNGEHSTTPIEAVAHLVNLSLTLKFGTNFESVDNALTTVEIEALNTKDVGLGRSESFEPTYSVALCSLLKHDTESLMSSCHNKLAALSDIYHLIKKATNQLKISDSKKDGDFFKLFAVCNGSVMLDRKKLLHLSKKIQFLLSYVNIDNEELLEKNKN
ncbi:zinc finger HIT domain-containing protein 2 [Bactrocera dorsalis]|uniref:Zinc finger HIT domain-containing protein 2 n=1 Tax=Bactrocera dorsalis TaxID=27457 RepID=A0A6I9UQ57_BACDO|nr:zinc finger HIT domain-containing protein 2 [Bactrocera dorsalis]